jgi:hypothetical protein
MIDQEIEQAIETHLPHGGGPMTAVRLRTALRTIAQRTETAARAYYLGNLRTVDDLAASFGVSRRRAQAIAKQHHDRWGKGMQIGGTYIFSEDEIKSMRPAESAGRPRKRTA